MHVRESEITDNYPRINHMKVTRTAPKGQDCRDRTLRLVITAEDEIEERVLAAFIGKSGESRMDTMFDEMGAEISNALSESLRLPS